MKRKAGFTLIELLVVIAIISLLSSILISSVAQARAKARDSKRIQDLKQVQYALELYYADHSAYPDYINHSSENRDCWDCCNNTYYDSNRLSVLGSYLPVRPTDPQLPLGSRYSGVNCGHLGYWYKVADNRQGYKISLVGTLEGLGGNPYANVPASMIDTKYYNGETPSYPTLSTISIVSPLCPIAMESWKAGNANNSCSQ